MELVLKLIVRKVETDQSGDKVRVSTRAAGDFSESVDKAPADGSASLHLDLYVSKDRAHRLPVPGDVIKIAVSLPEPAAQSVTV
jgi:hypothetical protein